VYWPQRGSERRHRVVHGQKAPARPQATVRRLGNRTESVGPTLCWGHHSRLGHVAGYGPNLDRGVDRVEPKDSLGSRHRLPHLVALDGRNAALAVASCVIAPVCFGCGYGCGSRGGREGLAQGLRGAKMPARDVSLLDAGLLEALRLAEGVWRGAGLRDGDGQRRGVLLIDVLLLVDAKQSLKAGFRPRDQCNPTNLRPRRLLPLRPSPLRSSIPRH
jgi:hypothetical protein